MSQETSYREPSSLSAGDTISFTRQLPDYQATDNWSLVYELRSGGGQAIQFTSTASGDDHVLLVTGSVTGTWLPGSYIMAGYAVNTDGTRHRIFYGTLPIYQNLQAAAGDAPVQTFAQKVVANLQALILNASGNNLLESRVGDTMFRYNTRKDLYEDYAKWVQVRRGEIDSERAANGLPSRNRISPMFRITSPGPLLGQPQWFGGFEGGIR